MSTLTIDKIKQLPPHMQEKALDLLTEYKTSSERAKARTGFLDYVHRIWPSFIDGNHHKVMADAFDRIISGDLKRLIINMPPRHTKSEFASWLLPSYFLGQFPGKKVMQLSHNADLAWDFGGRVRDLIRDNAEYGKIFGNTELQADKKAAGRWYTSEGGVYVAMGVGGRLAGKGADLLIIDDPHSEQEYMRALGGDNAAFDDAFEWYQSGPRQRLQPKAAIVIVMTRWHKRDITGRLIEKMTDGPRNDQWEVIEFPALVGDEEKPLWPEFWPVEELLATREELTAQQWAAQYMQKPTSEIGAILKREWWQEWEGRRPPPVEYVLQCWDTAFTASESADYSACTTWGVFYQPDEDGVEQARIVLLDALRGRWEFPELKRNALEQWKRRQPDAFVVEKKASGAPLIQELRRMGIPVSEYTPVRGTTATPNNKLARVNSVSDILESGMVYAPNTRWAQDVIQECAEFPMGDHDDYVDTVVMALMRFRQGGFIRLDSDGWEEGTRRRRKAAYY